MPGPDASLEARGSKVSIRRTHTSERGRGCTVPSQKCSRAHGSYRRPGPRSGGGSPSEGTARLSQWVGLESAELERNQSKSGRGRSVERTPRKRMPATPEQRGPAPVRTTRRRLTEPSGDQRKQEFAAAERGASSKFAYASAALVATPS